MSSHVLCSGDRLPDTGYFPTYRPLAPFQISLGVQVAEQVNQLSYYPCPARLVAGSKARAVVTVEVLVKEEMVAPVGVALELLRRTIHWSSARGIAQEYALETVCQLASHLKEVHPAPRTCRALHLE